MDKKNIKDKKIRNNYIKYNIKRILYKYNIYTSSVLEYYENDLKWEEDFKNNLDNKLTNIKKFNMLKKNSSKVRIKNRCILSGRGKSVYKDFGLSRHMFRKLALEGNLPGVKKSSW